MIKLGEKGIVQVIILLVLLAGLGAGLYLSQHTQIFKPKATAAAAIDFKGTFGQTFSKNSEGIPIATAREIQILFTSPLGPPLPNTTPTPTPTSTPLPSGTTLPSSSSYRRVFLTSNSYTGNLGGLIGADAKCQSRADLANLGGTWKAWLSDSTGSPSSRFDLSYIQANKPYKLLNGTTIANNWSDLIDGSLTSPIKVDEKGITQTVDPSIGTLVWSNTYETGIVKPTSPVGGTRQDCNNWTSSSHSAPYGEIGLYDRANSNWTGFSNTFCDSANVRLYCFEQTSTFPTSTPTASPSSSLSPTSTPAGFTRQFRWSLTPDGLAIAPWVDYSFEPRTLTHAFYPAGSYPKNERKFVWAEFKGSDGTIERKSAQIEFYIPGPKPTQSTVPTPTTFGKSAKFGSTEGSYITAPIFPYIRNYGGVTIEGWIKLDPKSLVGTNPYVFIAKEFVGGEASGYELAISNKKLEFKAAGMDNKYVIVRSNNNLEVDKWYFISAGAGSAISLRIDGVEQDIPRNLGGGGIYEPIDRLLAIGCAKARGDNTCWSQFYGEIEDLRISEGRAVLTSKPTSPLPSDQSVMELYRFDGDTKDSSGYALDGQVVGGVQFVDSTIISGTGGTPAPTPSYSTPSYLYPAPYSTPYGTPPIPSPTPTPTRSPVVCSACSADIDGNGSVDITDYSRLVACFNKASSQTDSSGRSCAAADINKNGVVNLDDFSCLSSKFGQKCTVPTPTPTPAAIIKPDLTISSLQSVSATANKKYNVQATIQNIGSGAASSHSVLVKVNNSKNQSQGTCSGTVSSLAGNKSTTINISNCPRLKIRGSYNLVVTVDANNQVVEANENNNQKSVTFSVK